jgi:hypothetical protein
MNTSNRWYWAVSILAVLIHILLIIRFMPLSTIQSGFPPDSGDWPIKFTEAYQIWQGGSLPNHTWVYSPAHLAGYPAGVYSGVGTQSYDLVLLATKALVEPVLAFNVYLFVLFLLPPLIPFLIIRSEGGGGRAQALGFLLSLLIWHVENHVSFMWTFGTTSFVTGSLLSVLVGSLFRKRLNTSNSSSYVQVSSQSVLIGMIAGICLLLHPFTALVLVAVCLPPLVGWLASLNRKGLLSILVIASMAILLNFHWINPFLALKSEAYSGGAPGPLAASVRHLIADVGFDRSFQRPHDTTAIFQLVLFLALFGIVKKNCELPHRWQWLISGILLLGITYLGSYLPVLKELQPYRFIAPVIFTFAIPAAFAASEILKQSSVWSQPASLILLVLFIPRLALPASVALNRSPIRPLSNDSSQVLSWLAEHTDKSGRLLFDSKLATLANYLPLFAERESIGGPYDHVVLAHRDAMPGQMGTGVEPPTWFGKEVNQLNESDIRDRLNLLNIGWVIIPSSSSASHWVAKVPNLLKLEANVGYAAIYRVAGLIPSFFLEGTGEVESGPNFIRLKNLSSGRVILKYHYLSSLQSSDGTKILPYPVKGSRVPFIMLENHHNQECKIKNNY